jgi:hypothetical protein
MMSAVARTVILRPSWSRSASSNWLSEVSATFNVYAKLACRALHEAAMRQARSALAYSSLGLMTLVR